MEEAMNFCCTDITNPGVFEICLFDVTVLVFCCSLVHTLVFNLIKPGSSRKKAYLLLVFMLDITALVGIEAAGQVQLSHFREVYFLQGDGILL